jgi:hypothetical protein
MPRGREFLITVLDWNLERLLYGSHVIREADGVLTVNALPENREQTELKLTIAARLAEQLKLACFVGDECLSTTPGERTWEYFHPLPGHERGHPH